MTENLLFTPITLPNGTTIKNRFFKSAMSEGMGTREFQPKKILLHYINVGLKAELD